MSLSVNLNIPFKYRKNSVKIICFKLFSEKGYKEVKL